MICAKPTNHFLVNTNVNLEVVLPVSGDNHTFTQGGVEIPYYDDVYGINPEVFNQEVFNKINIKESIINIMKNKMGQLWGQSCEMPAFSIDGGRTSTILINNYEQLFFDY